jgi:hypothetical protein
MRSAVQLLLPRVWGQQNLKTETDTALVFPDKWLRQLWDDLWFNMVIQKSAQMTMTTWGIVKALHGAYTRGETIIYTMPSDGDRNDLVEDRVDRIINLSPLLRKVIGREGRYPGQMGKSPVDNVGLKHIGKGAIYWRGTLGKTQSLSIPGHARYHDEVDASDEKILADYEHRLDALPEEKKQRYFFSHPSVPGYGINSLYESSDKRKWLVRCTGCNTWQELDYWRDQDRSFLSCEHCGQALDVSVGEWVAEHPGKKYHGYHVTRLLKCTPDRPNELESIHQARRDSQYPSIFSNKVLGLPSEEGAVRITKEQLLATCFVEHYLRSKAAEIGTGPYYMGVDQRDVLNVIISRCDPILDKGHNRVVFMGQLRDPTRGTAAWGDSLLPDGTPSLGMLMRMFTIKLAVVDAGPNANESHEFANKFPGRVLLSYYSDNQRMAISIADEVLEQLRIKRATDPMSKWDFTVNRTQVIDDTVKDLLDGTYMLPGPPLHHENLDYFAQIEHNVRIVEEDRKGNAIARWTRSGGSNDYLHATVYNNLATKLGTIISQLGGSVAPIGISGTRSHGR